MSTRIMSQERKKAEEKLNEELKEIREEAHDPFNRHESRKGMDALERSKLEKEFTQWKFDSGSEVYQKIQCLTGTDVEFEYSLKRAYFFSGKFPSNQFTMTVHKHNDKEGKFNIFVKSMLYDVPDLSELPSGRYRLVLKYYDPYHRVKGGGLGGIKTTYRDVVCQGSAANAAGGEEGRTPDPNTGIINQEEYKKAVQEINKLYQEAFDASIQAMKNRQAIEDAAYKRGYEDGKRAAEMPPQNSGNSETGLIAELLKGLLAEKLNPQT